MYSRAPFRHKLPQPEAPGLPAAPVTRAKAAPQAARAGTRRARRCNDFSPLGRLPRTGGATIWRTATCRHRRNGAAKRAVLRRKTAPAARQERPSGAAKQHRPRRNRAFVNICGAGCDPAIAISRHAALQACGPMKTTAATNKQEWPPSSPATTPVRTTAGCGGLSLYC